MPKYRLKTDPPVDVVKIEKPADHPSIVVDPDGFRAPYIEVDRGSCIIDRQQIYKGMILMLRDDKPVGAMPESQFHSLYEPVPEAIPGPVPGPPRLTDRIIAKLVEMNRGGGEDPIVAFRFDAGSRARLLAENADVPEFPSDVEYPEGAIVMETGPCWRRAEEPGGLDPRRITDRILQAIVTRYRACNGNVTIELNEDGRRQLLDENPDVPTTPNEVVRIEHSRET